MALMEEALNLERRKHPRFNVDLPVKYNSRSKLFSKYGRAVNASEGGLLVRLPEEMAVGQRIALRLFYHSRSELNIIAPSVEVVWTGIHLKNDFTWDYRTGVRFVDVPPKDMMKLRNFLTSFAQEPSYSS
jgi:c-di-GMP-binding flagellar brake protein YcgR